MYHTPLLLKHNGTAHHTFEYEVKISPHKGSYYSLGSSINYSVMGYKIHLRRWLGPHLWNVYLPTGTLVLISFISFSIPVEQVPGRMALIVTIFLMLVNIRSAVGNKGPKVLFSVTRRSTSKKVTL